MLRVRQRALGTLFDYTERELMKRDAGSWAEISAQTGFKKAFEKVRAKKSGEALLSAIISVVGLAVAFTLFLVRARSVGAVDEDAFISFRYAQNLLAGEGLVFNPDGQKVEGITNLLWTLFIAAGSWLTGSGLPTVAVTLGLVCGLLLLLLTWAWGFEELTGRGISLPLAAGGALAAPLLLAIAPGFAFYSASGLEVTFFALLVTAGLYFLRVGGRLWCASAGSLLLSAAAMTRPEGAMVLAFAVAAYAFWPGKDTLRRLIAAAVPGGIVLAGVTLWRLYYYGALVPNTAFAKVGGFEVMERWGWPYVVEAAGQTWFHLAWLLALVGAISQRGFLKRNLATLCVVPAWVAYIIYAGGDYLPFNRFVLPMLPFLYVLAVVGVGLVCWRLLGSLRGLTLLFGAVAAALPILVIIAVFVAQVPDQVQEEAKHGDYLENMTERRRAAANWFDKNAPEALVVRDGVGAFGYYSEDVRLLDALGLNDRYIARHGQRYPSLLPGHQTSDGEYIVSREPDYVMLGQIGPPFRFASDKELSNTPEFREEYEKLVIELETGDKSQLWKRKEGA